MTQILKSVVLQNTHAMMYDGIMNQETTPSKIESGEDWIERLQHTYNVAIDRYQQGIRDAEQAIPETSLSFLESIGMSAQELYDFVEDWVTAGQPPLATVAAIAAVRRDYFVNIQKRNPSGHVVETSSLPPGLEELDGYPWLPRIIAKAQAKLRGEMSHDIMYGCGADQPFLHKVGIDPAEFLQLVWQAGNNKHVILKAAKR